VPEYLFDNNSRRLVIVDQTSYNEMPIVVYSL